MLEESFGLLFFQKATKKADRERYIYLRITVDGIPKEMSTKRKWDSERWNQNTGRATGGKEDARSLNYFLDSLSNKIYNAKTDLLSNDITITSQNIMDIIQGKVAKKSTLLQEFQIHNEEMLALVPSRYAKGTYTRFITAKSHVEAFIKFKYNRGDIEFRELNFQFVKDYEFWLRTAKVCNNNTTLKYIANLKKIVKLAIDKQIISADPFIRFKGRKTKVKKQPLKWAELKALEDQQFSTNRLTIVRDIFVFQCYTGLAYIDAYQLKKTDIVVGIDGNQWIESSRQKTKSETNIPLLPQAIAIIDKYKDHPICNKRGSVLPVSSNQKMNEYLKEIGAICGISASLNTHKARRTFASTVTLNNDVPMHVVKEMLGHNSIRQTEEYAITGKETVATKMRELKIRLEEKACPKNVIIKNVEGRPLTLEDIYQEMEKLQKMVDLFTKS